jgi:hypothetical protein
MQLHLAQCKMRTRPSKTNEIAIIATGNSKELQQLVSLQLVEQDKKKLPSETDTTITIKKVDLPGIEQLYEAKEGLQAFIRRQYEQQRISIPTMEKASDDVSVCVGSMAHLTNLHSDTKQLTASSVANNPFDQEKLNQKLPIILSVANIEVHSDKVLEVFKANYLQIVPQNEKSVSPNKEPKPSLLASLSSVFLPKKAQEPLKPFVEEKTGQSYTVFIGTAKALDFFIEQYRATKSTPIPPMTTIPSLANGIGIASPPSVSSTITGNHQSVVKDKSEQSSVAPSM